MATIENPWHSRPLDVHRWSEHPEVAAFVDRVWAEYLPEEAKSGPRPKTPFRHQLRVLILDSLSDIGGLVQLSPYEAPQYLHAS